MTMRELAKLANVSVSTVSKAFADAEDVGNETKQHIFRIAKEKGCFGKFYKGKFPKKVYAIICSELISNYYIGFVERLQNFIEKNNGIAVISVNHFDAARQAELIEYYASYLHVDGILVFGLQAPIKKGYEIPLVALFSSIDTNVDSVKLNIESALGEVVKHLYALGHRKLAYLYEPLTVRKAHFFQEICSTYSDIEVYSYQSQERFELAGQDGAQHVLEAAPDCTALVCAYDNVAIGAIKQLQKAGYTVPGDYSVIGSDNINTLEFLETTLSSIDSCPDEICQIAWDLLSRKEQNRYWRSNREIIVKGIPVMRESVGAPRTNAQAD